MADKKKLGEILVDANILTDEQLQQALRIQKTKGGKLGQILVDLGLVDERTIADIIGKQRNFRRIDLNVEDIDENAVALIPKDVCQKYRIIPVKIENNMLILAMDDPLNYFAVDIAEFVSSYRVVPAIAEPSKIEEALGSLGEEVQPTKVKDQFEDSLQTLPDKDVPEDEKGKGIIKFVNMMLTEGVDMGASDIHIEADPANTRIRYRLNGVLIEKFRVPAPFHEKIISRLKVIAKMDIAEREMPQTGGFRLDFDGKKITMRMEIIPTIRGENASIRFAVKGTQITSINQLGLTPHEVTILSENIFKPGGLVIVCGPTGSGKTTTLYSIIRKISSPEKKVFTLENPVEEFIPLVNQIQINPERGLTFSTALRSVIRMDPDIILVGEIRDPESARNAIRAAYTGHLVLTTLHTRSTFESIFRLIDLGIEPYLLMDTINLIIGQRLVRTLCDKCKTAVKLNDGRIVNRASGCLECKNTGYKGRLGVFEFLPGHIIDRDMLSTDMTLEGMVERAKAEGIETLWHKGVKKVLSGETSMTEIVRAIPKMAWD